MANELYGQLSVITMRGGEDFAVYLQDVPGFFFWLGCRNPKETIAYPWHHTLFHVDDEALEGGARLLAECVHQYHQSQVLQPL